MRRPFRISVMIVAIVLASLLGVSLTQAQQTDDSLSATGLTFQEANLPWNAQYAHQVDYPDDVGSYASLALRPYDNLPYISYYDSTNGDLMLAHLMPLGNGDCGTDNKWKCERLDGDLIHGSDNVGSYTSIDFWADESNSAWRIGISYHDTTNRGLKYISWYCDILCTQHRIVTIDSTDINLVSIGLYTSLKFGPTGEPNIVYYYSNSIGNDSLRYAYPVASGGNCGEGSDEGEWQCDIIDSGDRTGQYASMDLTYDGTVYIAYYDRGLGNLKLANYWGIIEDDCYLDNGWWCVELDSVGDVGMYASLAAQHFPGDKLYRVAYYDATNEQLKYTDIDWDPLVVDDMGPDLSPMGISMDVDPDGAPIIAYKQNTSEFGPPELNIARPFFVYDDGNFGNCGDTPPGYIFLYWRCDTVDNGGQYLEVAEFVSIKLNPAGFANIAYSEFVNIDVGDHATSLKFISQKAITFLPLILKP